jgi:CheY-like chemotaxis protein
MPVRVLQYIVEGTPPRLRRDLRGMHGCGIAGGCLVAKILVADDNSNIQKMVTLALKDQGIDVVAVGNGEAAVRKISDIHPDLVLADVFMPVRNGYEVCQYVKTDPALAHIPVILLVGAFDPLDEQEAQRVGADGVLKKPFVPPDPLISMVKSALARAGVAIGAAGAAKASEPEPVKATDFLAPRVPPAPAYGNVPAPPVQREEPAATVGNESFVDELPVRPEPVKFETGVQPVAFGSLLSAVPQQTEEDAAFLPPVNPELAMDRDWREKDSAEDTDEEEEEKSTPAWRHEETETFADSPSNASKKSWRSGGFEPAQSTKSQVASWEPEEEKPLLHEVNARAQESPADAQAIPGTRTEIPAAPFASEAWTSAIASNAEKKSPEDTATALEEITRPALAPQSLPEPVIKSSGNSWFSSPSSPWDSEIQKANKLASAWDSGTAASLDSSNGAGKAAEPTATSETVQAAIEEAALPAAAVEAIREEAAQVAEEAVQHAAGGADSYVHAEAPEAAAPSTPSMDELVAKVLANMSPDVLQAVTREILRPVVEAMVKEEMKSKKS